MLLLVPLLELDAVPLPLSITIAQTIHWNEGRLELKLGMDVSLSIMRTLFKGLTIIVCLTLILIATIEGISSFILFAGQIGGKPFVAERLHTEYDPELGWINKPDFYLEDMYGPGKYLKTNKQRFRNNRRTTVEAPEGKRRWICSGDSFTLGFGVANDDTWCAQLSKAIPSVDHVNMGQGGYGIDQAYLWYKRDGYALHHELLIFAFISGDVYRMKHSEFHGYSKPVLKLQQGKLVPHNVPVPKPDLFTMYVPRYERELRTLKTSELITKIIGPAEKGQISINSNKELVEMTMAIFADLQNLSQQNDRTSLFVHLPTQRDYSDRSSDHLIALFKEKSKTHGWHYFDLIEDFRRLNPKEVPELFIQKDILNYSGAPGHYTEKGNSYISEILLKRMAADPNVAALAKTGNLKD
jgi:hypothetical protein